jgi:hypothetical protein
MPDPLTEKIAHDVLLLKCDGPEKIVLAGDVGVLLRDQVENPAKIVFECEFYHLDGEDSFLAENREEVGHHVGGSTL